MAFRHWKLRPPAKKDRETLVSALPFLHITAAWAFVVWGLNAAFPFPFWQIGLGAYLFFWVGWESLYTLARFGIYLIADMQALRQRPQSKDSE